MDLNQFKIKVDKALAYSGNFTDVKVLKVRPVEDQCIVYVSSPTFTGGGVNVHSLLREAIKGPGSPLTVAEQKSICLFRTYTPDAVRAIKRMRKRRKLR